MKIEIAGHTDNKGDKKYNQTLSQKRAESVVNYLVKKGIAASRD
jgi:outer membrane protein OmpA-like peptidoglycan-associated protein